MPSHWQSQWVELELPGAHNLQRFGWQTAHIKIFLNTLACRRGRQSGVWEEGEVSVVERKRIKRSRSSTRGICIMQLVAFGLLTSYYVAQHALILNFDGTDRLQPCLPIFQDTLIECAISTQQRCWSAFPVQSNLANGLPACTLEYLLGSPLHVSRRVYALAHQLVCLFASPFNIFLCAACLSACSSTLLPACLSALLSSEPGAPVARAPVHLLRLPCVPLALSSVLPVDSRRCSKCAPLRASASHHHAARPVQIALVTRPTGRTHSRRNDRNVVSMIRQFSFAICIVFLMCHIEFVCVCVFVWKCVSVRADWLRPLASHTCIFHAKHLHSSRFIVAQCVCCCWFYCCSCPAAVWLISHACQVLLRRWHARSDCH